MRVSSVVMSLLLVVSIVPIAYTQSDFGVKGLGGRIGLIMPEDPYDNSIGFGIQADMGRVTTDISMSVFLDYWGKSFDQAINDTVPAEWSYSSTVVGADFKYVFPLKARTKPYVGEGVGLVFSRDKKEPKYKDDAPFKRDESDTDIAFHMLWGIEHIFSPSVKGLTELKYHIGAMKYVSVFAGITFMFGD